MQNTHDQPPPRPNILIALVESFQVQQSLPLPCPQESPFMLDTTPALLPSHLQQVSPTFDTFLTAKACPHHNPGREAGCPGGVCSLRGPATHLHLRAWLVELLVPLATSQGQTSLHTVAKHSSVFIAHSRMTNINLLLNYVSVREPFSPQKILLISDRASAGRRAERAAEIYTLNMKVLEKISLLLF